LHVASYKKACKGVQNVAIRRREFDGLLSPIELGSDEVCFWAATPPYSIVNGLIVPGEAKNTRPYSPMANPDLFLSLARLGSHGEPSEGSILGWVNRYGLLKGYDKLRKSGRLHHGPYIKVAERIVQHPLKVNDFRTEVRCAKQLLRLYADVRSRDYRAVAERFLAPSTPHGALHSTIVDQYMADWRSSHYDGVKWMLDQGITSLDREGEHLFRTAWDIVLDSLFYMVRDVRLSLTDLPIPGGQETDGTLPVRSSMRCPDLLSAAYLQFYLMVVGSRSMRNCDACGMPFPAKPKNKRHCNPTCRSNARHYRSR
jgi:hypothetical protein